MYHSREHGGCIFFFNDTATTEIYTLSLHDALPILIVTARVAANLGALTMLPVREERQIVHRVEDASLAWLQPIARSEEHTSELQSCQYLVCRLLLEKKKNTYFACPLSTSSFLASYV